MDGIAKASHLPDVLLELTDTLGPQFDTAGLLFHLAAVSVQLLDVDAAGVLLLDDAGRLRQVVATDDRTHRLEQLQATTHRGPCPDSVRLGRAVFCHDLEQDGDPWPEFTRRALDEGFHAVHALPLSLHTEVVGGLNLFSRTTGLLPDTDRHIAYLLATAAATGLLHRQAVHERDTVNEQLQCALDSRIIIERAKGYLVARLELTPDLAFTLLRAYARSRSTRLTDVAQAVVDGRVVLTGTPDPPGETEPDRARGEQRPPWSRGSGGRMES